MSLRSGAHAALDLVPEPRETHRVVLDPEGSVVESSEGTWSWLGIAPEPKVAEVKRILDAAGVLPPPTSRSGAAFSRVRRPDGRVVEVAACRVPGGGHALVMRDDPTTSPEGPARRMLTMAAHELRTPLTVIEGAARALRRRAGVPPNDSPEILEALERGVARLGELIHAVLEAGALAAGTMKLKRDPVDAGQVASEAVEAARVMTGRADIALRGLAAGPLLVADRKRLQWVLRELLLNAAKCSEPGSGITLELDERGQEAQFRVIDHGRGVPDDLREAIFDPFRQADSTETRAVPGLGLGLSICRGIAALHGGSVAVQAAAGPTTFALRLPLPTAPADPEPLTAFPDRSQP